MRNGTDQAQELWSPNKRNQQSEGVSRGRSKSHSRGIFRSKENSDRAHEARDQRILFCFLVGEPWDLFGIRQKPEWLGCVWEGW